MESYTTAPTTTSTTTCDRPKAVLSLHVPSMKQSSQLVSALLTQVGFDVCICSDVSGGGEYRDEIEKNIQNADVVVMLLNNHWAKSDQCKHELKFAQQLHCPLTPKGNNKPPALLSIAFSDLKWHPIFLVSTDLICHNTENLLTGDLSQTLTTLREAAVKQLHIRRIPIKCSKGNGYEIEEYTDDSGRKQFRVKDLKTGLLIPEDKYEVTERLDHNNVCTRKIYFKKTDKKSSPHNAATSMTDIDKKCEPVDETASSVKLDKKTAAQLYESVFGSEKPESICRLARCYLEGNGGVEKDTRKAVQLYEKAAACGSACGAYNAAMLYEKGEKSLCQDLDKAEILYNKAAEAGDTHAKKRLQKVSIKKLERNNPTLEDVLVTHITQFIVGVGSGMGHLV